MEELLGEELYKQVQEKLGDKKVFLYEGDQQVAVVNDGNWFPKEKFNQVNEEKKTYKTQVEEFTTQLEELQKNSKGGKEMAEKVQELQDELLKKSQEFEKQELINKKKYALDVHLRDANAKHPDLLAAKFNLEEIQLDGDRIKDWENVFKPIKEQYGDLFGEKKIEGYNPTRPAGENGFYTKEQVNAMSPDLLKDSKVLELVNKSMEKW